MNTKSTFTATTRSTDKEFIVIGKRGKEEVVREHLILARSPFEALGIFLKRGRFGLSPSWRLSRNPDGWIIAVNTAGRNLERKMFKLREKNYTPGMPGMR